VYKWKDGDIKRDAYGLIAQKTKEILPQIVHMDSRGYLSISYLELIPVLVEGMKEYMHHYRIKNEGVDEKFEEIQRSLEHLESLVEENEEQEFSIELLPRLYEKKRRARRTRDRLARVSIFWIGLGVVGFILLVLALVCLVLVLM